tara:strand:- start:536 stop:637 length:102 start_codon:yes stop_codon:yes gene_type:complete
MKTPPLIGKLSNYINMIDVYSGLSDRSREIIQD